MAKYSRKTIGVIGYIHDEHVTDESGNTFQLIKLKDEIVDKQLNQGEWRRAPADLKLEVGMEVTAMTPDE